MPRPPKPLNPGSSGLALFGSTLRMYRDQEGLTQDQLGTDMNFSSSTIGQVERGESRCERDFAERADERLGTRGALAHLWDYLVKPRVYPKWFADWPKYESEAMMLRNYQALVVGGLLQTEDYARALLYGNEADVAARMARQGILTRAEPRPPHLVCVFSEIVLLHQVGPPKVMHDQLLHIVESVSDHLSVQIVPNGVVHPGNAGSFVLATLEDGSEVAYTETAARGLTLGDKQDLQTLNESFAKISAQALPVGMSMDLINRTAEERWT